MTDLAAYRRTRIMAHRLESACNVAILALAAFILIIVILDAMG